MYLNGKGTPAIARILNTENILPPCKYIESKRYEKCKGVWTKTTVYRILTNEVYIGTVVGKKSYKINHKLKTRVITPKNERIYVKDKHEAIIEKKKFEMVQIKMKERIKCRNRQNINPIKKLVYCGLCGAKAIVKVHKRQVKSGDIHVHQYFICGNKNQKYLDCLNGSISSNYILALTLDKIRKECSTIIFSEDDLMELYEQSRQNSDSKKNLLKKDIVRNENEIKQIENKIETIYIDKLNNLIKEEDFKKFYDLYQNKKEKLILVINSLNKELKKNDNQKNFSYNYMKKAVESFLRFENIEEDLLTKLIDKIEFVKGKMIKIKYKFMENK